MSGDHEDLRQYQRKLLDRLSRIKYIREPGQRVQLKTLFQFIVDRDVVNIRKFRRPGFANIFQAHEAITGNTVLHVAAYKNDLDLIAWFLHEGAQVDARNRGVSSGITCCSHTLKITCRHSIVMTGTLKWIGIVIHSQGTTPLMVAAHHGYFDLVQLLITKGANLEAEDRFGQNVLWYCFGGTDRNAQIVALCMGSGDSPARPQSNAIGKPLLVKACEKGNKTKEIVELILRHGGGVNDVAVRTGRTALIEAARRGSVSVMKLLLSEGANVDALDYKQVNWLIMSV